MNDNAAKLTDPLYCPVISVAGDLRDDDGHLHRLDLRGNLAFAPPRSLFIKLDHGLEPDQMRIGSNDRDYWLIIRPRYESLWWGRHANAGRPCVQSMPLDPTRVVAAMGLTPLESRGALGPLRLCEDNGDHLIYSQFDTLTGLRTDVEYVVSRFAPFLIKQVIFRDGFGRPDTMIDLDEYRPLGDAGPMVARRVKASWPQEKSWMSISLESARMAKVNPRTFVRPTEPPAGIQNVIQVDAPCDTWPEDGGAPASQPGSAS